MVQRLSARLRRLQRDAELLFHSRLADELRKFLRTQLEFKRRVIVHRGGGDQAFSIGLRFHGHGSHFFPAGAAGSDCTHSALCHWYTILVLLSVRLPPVSLASFIVPVTSASELRSNLYITATVDPGDLHVNARFSPLPVNCCESCVQENSFGRLAGCGTRCARSVSVMQEKNECMES